MFVEAKKRPYRQLDFKLWKRELGALWIPFEREKITEFSKVKANERIRINGYVKWISNTMFGLVPTLFSNQIYLLCLNNTDTRPRENSYITISGRTRWTNIKRLLGAPPLSTLYEGNVLVQVNDWKNVKPDFQIPKTNFEFKDFKENLTSRIEGLEPKLADFLAFTTISTPMFYENIGGVNLTLYDSTKSGIPKLVVRELRRVIPPDMGSLCTIGTPFGKFGMRYKYTFMAEDADRPLSKTTETFLAHKTSEYITEYQEASLSLFSARDKPRTIEDPPCSLSDIPTVVPEEIAILRGRPGIDQFDAFKYVIVNHMKTPVIEDYETSVVSVANNLEKLRESWDLDPVHLTRYGFLDANYNAKPTSVVRESLALARSQDVNAVTPQQVSKVFDDYFKWNFAYVYEIWEDLLAHPLVGKKPLLSLRVKYRDIIRIIRRYESTNLPGVSKEIIVEEAKTSPSKTDLLIKDCLRGGIIYEPLKGYYRLTRPLS